MAPPNQRAPARRVWLLAAAAAFAGLLLAAPVATAPGVGPTCTKLLELAAIAGEPVGEPARDACERHYAKLRAERGLLGWARLSWCTRGARSIPEAGGC